MPSTISIVDLLLDNRFITILSTVCTHIGYCSSNCVENSLKIHCMTTTVFREEIFIENSLKSQEEMCYR